MRKIISALLVAVLCLASGCATTEGEGDTLEASTSAEKRSPSDTEITAAVEAALAEDDLLTSSNIQVSSEQGKVTLSGRVPSPQAFNRAISVARGVPGVKPPVSVSNLEYP